MKYIVGYANPTKRRNFNYERSIEESKSSIYDNPEYNWSQLLKECIDAYAEETDDVKSSLTKLHQELKCTQKNNDNIQGLILDIKTTLETLTEVINIFEEPFNSYISKNRTKWL